MDRMDNIDKIINCFFYNLFKNNTIEQVVEQFPNIKETILVFLNRYAEKNNLQGPEKEDFINGKYNKIKIIKLVEEKWNEKNKEHIKYLTILLEMGINPGNMSNEEALQVEQELINRMKKNFEFDKKIIDFEFDQYMSNFKRNSTK